MPNVDGFHVQQKIIQKRNGCWLPVATAPTTPQLTVVKWPPWRSTSILSKSFFLLQRNQCWQFYVFKFGGYSVDPLFFSRAVATLLIPIWKENKQPKTNKEDTTNVN